MNNLLRGVCLLTYALALIGLFIELPSGLGPVIQTVAVILLAAHGLEVLVAFKRIRRYPGSLAASVALTVLFGFLHWLPLAKEDARAAK